LVFRVLQPANGVSFSAFVDSHFPHLSSKENRMSLKKTSVAALMAVSGVVVSSASFAQAKPVDTGLYLGASVGQATSGDCNVPSCDDKDTSYRVFGGYQFNRNLAVEAGYAPLGEVSGGNLNLETNAWDLVGVGIWPLNQQFSIYGKLGFYNAEAKLSGPVSGKKTTTDLTYGLGGQFNISRNLGLRLEWQRYGGVEAPQIGGVGGDTDIDTLNLGALWKF
jgi:OmpA-OmpF porin, OOP family